MAVEYLTDHVSKELHALKPATFIYFGLGRDVWVPFGILDARHVVAWDIIDEHVIPVGWHASPRQRLYGYAVLLTNDLLSMFAKVKSTEFDEDQRTFTIHFSWRKHRRSLTVFLQDYHKVATFPRADGVLFGGTTNKKTREQVVEQSGAAFWMEPDDEGIAVMYPASMQEFLDKWVAIDELAYNQKSIAKQIWAGYHAQIAESSPNTHMGVHHVTGSVKAVPKKGPETRSPASRPGAKLPSLTTH